ncbi:MAG: autotransporter-associated beta strand repeat-containing protein, partial [Planctomycetaceae bacterium]
MFQRTGAGRAVVWALLAAACWAAAPSVCRAQSPSINERLRLDLLTTSGPANAAFIGTNPSAVAWDGTRLYVAGFNSQSTRNTGIVEVQAPLAAPGFVVPSFSAAFGLRSTNQNFGYSGLALQQGTLAAAWDNGAGMTNPITAFDAAAGNAPIWNTASGSNNVQRGMGGVAFDPGYNGNPVDGAGVAWLTITAGRRLMQDTATGATVYTITGGSPGVPGMDIRTPTGNVVWRDVDFDPDNGNLYTRRSNDVTFAIRSGSNSVSSTGWIVNDGGTASTIVGQNLSFMNNLADPAGTFTGDAIVYNSRTSSSAGQNFATVVRTVAVASGSVGTPLAAAWNFLSGSAYATGVGYYDFDYDAATRSLALVDYANRTVSIFDVDVAVRTVSSGTEIAAPLAGTKPLAKQGAGTLVVDQAGAAAAGTIYVEQGTLQIGSGGTSGSAGAPLAITVSSGATLAFDRSDDYGGNFANAIGGAGGLEVKGGRLALSAANRYTGPTVVSAGTLKVDGNQAAATGAVTVASGATLAGSGTVGGATTIQSGATLSPGASPGTLTFTQGITLSGGGNYNWQVYDAAGVAGSTTGWDLVNVGGALDVASTSLDPFKINLWSLSGVGPDVNGNAINFNAATSGTWRIASAAGGITNFDPGKFAINVSATNGTGGFTNSLSGGTFSLAQ